MSVYFVFGHDEEESFERIEKMVHGNDSLKNKSSLYRKSIGFGG